MARRGRRTRKSRDGCSPYRPSRHSESDSGRPRLPVVEGQLFALFHVADRREAHPETATPARSKSTFGARALWFMRFDQCVEFSASM